MAKVEKSDAFITSKQNAADKRRAKQQAIVAKFKGGNEPETDPFNYQLSLIKTLNWYNINVELKEIRKYLNEYLTSTNQKKLIPILNQASDFDIRSLGLLCRLKLREQYLTDEHEIYIPNRIEELVSIYDIPKTVDPVIRTPTAKVDKTREQSLIHSEAIEGAIDEFVKTKKSTFDASGYLKSSEVTAPVAKEIGTYYKSVLNELKIGRAHV